MLGYKNTNTSWHLLLACGKTGDVTKIGITYSAPPAIALSILSAPEVGPTLTTGNACLGRGWQYIIQQWMLHPITANEISIVVRGAALESAAGGSELPPDTQMPESKGGGWAQLLSLIYNGGKKILGFDE